MRLSWNQIAVNAKEFSDEWKDARYEKSDTQSFYNDFFGVFGVKRRRVATFEQRVKKLDNSDGYIDLFWTGTLLVEQKSEGRDLEAAYDQAGDYFDALEPSECPRYIMVSDFQTFELHDLDERTVLKFDLADLHKHVQSFGFVVGVTKRTFRDQDPVNIEAAELVAEFHDTLKAAGYTGHELEQYLVRLVFCLFADDTGIFDERGQFETFIEDRTSPDGSDLGPWIAQVFQVLNMPMDQRPHNLDTDLESLPYVNGDLFSEPLQMPSYDADMRQALLDVCAFDWSDISPAIFGALFQTVMDPAERRAQGAHYTTEQNILKVIEPLFLNDLRDELDAILKRRDRGRLSALTTFQQKLADIRILDPACGCGNFLVIAYRELRRLEIEVILAKRQMVAGSGQQELAADTASMVNVDQFYGIEILEFPVRVAEAAMWMMDHVMNNELSLELGEVRVRIPLQVSPSIAHVDALQTEWGTLLPADECTYVIGNPPFVGVRMQAPDQRAQVKRIANLGGRAGTLDYAAAWFIKASEYASAGNATVGLVATNSLTQGEQVAQLWTKLFDDYDIDIYFAHRTFPWGSDARGKAHVHVVIVGFGPQAKAPNRRLLFTYTDSDSDASETSHATITPYLTSGDGLANPRLMIANQRQRSDERPQLIIGSKPVDGGYYLFDYDESEDFLSMEPTAKRFLFPFIGAREFLRGHQRWILALHSASPKDLARMPHVQERIAAVKDFRLASRSRETNDIADTPMSYHVNVIPDAPFLVVPKSSSQTREYLPMDWSEPPTVPGDAVFVLQDATLRDFAVLTSAMHMAWLRLAGGRLKSDYRYSIGTVYNTFPLPAGLLTDDLDTSQAEQLAQEVLDARDNYAEATLAELYNPLIMPADLKRAHRRLDQAVDRLYRHKKFESERERVEHLLRMYEKAHA